MKLQFLGGAREVGRSAILVNDALLLDYGMLTGNPPQYPVASPDPEAVVVSHGHLDHVGAVPTLLSGDRRPPVHWTPPTYELAMTLARDTLKLHGGTYDCPFTETHVQRMTQVSNPHGYGETFEAAGHEVTLYNAGHIPGSAHVLVDDGDTRLFYTADFHTGDQRLVSGTTARPDADVVVCESTYAGVDHDPREEVERRFAESLQTTMWEGGTVVVPAFAIGRTQEMLLVCDAHDLECYVDGMGKDVTRMLRNHPEFVRDADALSRATSHARFVTGRDGQRKRIARQNTVVVTTSGMLSGGPAMTYIPEVRGDPTNKITMTGYQVEGTPGRELLERGRAEIDGRIMPISARAESYDFSAHADHDGLREFLAPYEGTRVLVNHGDDCESFAAELREDDYDASAPAVGDVVEL
ncbi:putative mRNA 3-end processing factor [Halogranum amylolyticum]|uniref:Putative mRNA 3-end processing factor n=1 Tax=Halogranum amylolyticum TaxID=660520 RepID=A0A1H8TT04_9EURY|nr:MBL fold metallo-hydrolase [Halogranum amylolyticum]SEO94001.1 putative mRNA 3-end processing factor [Halogranum amylolyticum]